MNIHWTGLALVAAALGATGCSTYFTGTAPAKAEGSVYVSGAKAGFLSQKGAIWQCPSAGGECKRIHVEEENR